MPAALEWTTDNDLTVGGVRYRCGLGKEPSPDQMTLLKRRPLIRAYADLVADRAPTRILELGVFSGGSTVLLAQLAPTKKLGDHPSRRPRA
jgi:hypothetical protein